MSIIQEYFKLTRKHKEEYGDKTVVLMLVGVFYEIYGIKNPVETHPSTNIEDISHICNLAIVEDKKALYDNYPILTSGFRDYTLEKYLQKLSDAGYTSAVYNQNKSGLKITRELAHIYSPGTFIPYDETVASSRTTNHIMAIWIERLRKPSGERLLIGTAVINIFTGESIIYEYQTSSMITPITFDELERQISTILPNEIIVISDIDRAATEKLVQYSGISTTKTLTHYMYTKHSDHVHTTPVHIAEKIQNCTKQNYIRNIIACFFSEETYDICIEFRENELATQAFCFLLNFIQEHNPDLVRRISMPLFDQSNTRMLLACHTLKQLNIIDAEPHTTNTCHSLTSVANFANRCCTPMGKRKLYDQITKPTFDQSWLNQEYKMTDIILSSDQQNTICITALRKSIHCIRDLDKILRQIVLKKIYPAAIYHLYESIQTIQSIYTSVIQVDLLDTYLRPKTDLSASVPPASAAISDICQTFTQFVQENLRIHLCKSVSSITTFEDNIFQRGVSDKLDTLYDTNRNATKTFVVFREWLNHIMFVKTNDKCEYVKEHTTEKSGVSLQITKKRAEILKTLLPTFLATKINGDDHPYHELLTQYEFVSANATTFELTSPKIAGLTKQMLYGKEQLNQVIAQTYQTFLTHLETQWYQRLDLVSKYIANLDVIVSKAYLAKHYNYCRPQINADADKSFVEVQRLRHPLIEHIQKNEIYVANDLVLGRDEVDGILLYGTNAVGKTSFIRAVGIAVIMAQAGLYVAASQFSYRPYKSVFSRILGNDDLFRGLSTFAVEMSELRVILKFADQSSLILGDELCSGTEIESALSIFMAGLMGFHQKRASFLFATHFHQIMEYSEMAECPRIHLKHMSVIYDREQDALVYDRILKDGPGNRMYGLEVCKSLHLDDAFLETAYRIRNKYAHDGTVGQLALPASNYNTTKIRGICEMCKKTLSDEIHHLSPQKSANKRGFIDTFHKNHPANLMALCTKCHDLAHRHTVESDALPPTNTPVGQSTTKTSTSPIVKKKTTNGYVFHSVY
jgi:DNA mismatch repair protein MutS